jgi:hypothetical protein
MTTIRTPKPICLNSTCRAPTACASFGYCRERETNQRTHLELLLEDALAGMFALHEPEGRFQPSHFKGPLRKARVALSVASGRPEEAITQALAQRWREAQKYVRDN